MSNQPALRTRGLGKRFGAVRALHNLDLELAPGEVVGYLGPNGAGKTTTLRVLLGLVRPTAGTAQVFGADCTRDPITAHRYLASVPGEATLWPSLTGAETLHLLGRVHGRVDTGYRDELVQRFSLDPSRKVGSYSKGNRQKVMLIAAMMTRAPLLLLDEPTSGLDPLMERAFRLSIQEARQRGQAVLLSSHILGEVESLCDRVAILRAGVLVETGTLAELRHLSAMTVELTLAGPVPDLSAVAGVRDLHLDGRQVRLQVVGSVQPLLEALRGSQVTQLLSRQPSLEELFLSHYGPVGPVADTAATGTLPAAAGPGAA